MVGEDKANNNESADLTGSRTPDSTPFVSGSKSGTDGMVHLVKDGFSALIAYDGKWVSIKTGLGDFSCTLDDLSSVLAGCTLQLSEASGAFLLILPARNEVRISAATLDESASAGCVIGSDEFAGHIRELRRKNSSANGARGL